MTAIVADAAEDEAGAAAFVAAGVVRTTAVAGALVVLAAAILAAGGVPAITADSKVPMQAPVGCHFQRRIPVRGISVLLLDFQLVVLLYSNKA